MISKIINWIGNIWVSDKIVFPAFCALMAATWAFLIFSTLCGKWAALIPLAVSIWVLYRVFFCEEDD